MRRLSFLCVLVAAAALAPAPASAAPVARPNAAAWAETLQTEHFLVHFNGDPDVMGFVLRQWAGELAANAEWAYSTYGSWGYPAPLDDGDGLIDVFVWDFDTEPDLAGVVALAARDDDALGQTSGWIEVDEDALRDPHVAAHELFHLVQYALYAPSPSWMKEATAEWATYRHLGYPSDDWLAMHEPDNSLDCVGTGCGLDGYEAGGYSHWTFWQYLGERFGQGVVKDVWDDVVTHVDPAYDGDDAIAAVMATKGTTLTDVYNDYTVTLLKGSFQAANLAGLLPIVYGTIETPTTASSMLPVRVAVNRLATRFLQFAAPAQPDDELCHPATLTVTVTLPAGVTSRPHFYWPATKALTALSVSGTTATGAIGWDTCSSEAPGYLSLPNSSQTLDARTFIVGASVTVDKTKVVSAKPAPPQATLIGTVIAAPTEDPAPELTFYGPEVLRVLTNARVIRLIVFSSGTGKLHGTFGGVPLGAVRLRAGQNQVRFRLPKPALRMVSSRRPLLELTSLSPEGSWGERSTQRVAFAKPKPKPKPKRPRPGR